MSHLTKCNTNSKVRPTSAEQTIHTLSCRELSTWQLSSTRSKAQTWPQFNCHALDNKLTTDEFTSYPRLCWKKFKRATKIILGFKFLTHMTKEKSAIFNFGESFTKRMNDCKSIGWHGLCTYKQSCRTRVGDLRLESVILRLETWLETWAPGLEILLVTWRLELELDWRIAANDVGSQVRVVNLYKNQVTI